MSKYITVKQEFTRTTTDMPVKIREMTGKDVPAVHQSGIEVAEFETSEEAAEKDPFWPKDGLYDWVENETDVLLVAEDDGEIVGYFLSQIHDETRTAYIRNVYIDKEYRRQGIARELVQEGIVQFDQSDVGYIAALVKPDNVPMKELLIELGFNEGNTFIWIDKLLGYDDNI